MKCNSAIQDAFPHFKPDTNNQLACYIPELIVATKDLQLLLALTISLHDITYI